LVILAVGMATRRAGLAFGAWRRVGGVTLGALTVLSDDMEGRQACEGVAAHACGRNRDAGRSVRSMAVLAAAANRGMKDVGLVLVARGAGFVQLAARMWLVAALTFLMSERSARRL
jgi:hypothetical protein